MNTFIAILQGIGFLTFFVGLATAVNTFFDLDLAFKGEALPKDYVSVIFFLIFGAIVWIIGTALAHWHTKKMKKAQKTEDKK